MEDERLNAIQDFFQDPTVYIEASKQTDKPLDEKTVQSIFTEAQKDIKGVAAALMQDKDFMNLVTTVYKQKKSSTQRFKLGGLISYMKCLKAGGTVDCNCKSKFTKSYFDK